MKTITLVLLLFSTFLFSQNTISGKVIDEFGPIQGVNIQLKNTQKGTITDSLGKFIMKVKPKDTLVLSYLGKQTKEVIVNKKDVIIELNEIDQLDEVFIEVYKSVKKEMVICETHGCTIECFGIPITEMEKNKEKDLFRLYPNPSRNGVFQLDIQKDFNNAKVFVFDMSGRLIQSIETNFDKKVKINLSQFSSGIYLVNTIVDGVKLPVKRAIRN